LQVSPKFKEKLDELQKKIMMARGEKISFRDLSEDIISSPLFSDIEREIIKSSDSLKMDIRIKFDKKHLR
jgi:hypothetical protein